MGNLQTSDGKGPPKSGTKGGGRQKMRLLGGKKGAKAEEWTSVVPEETEKIVPAVLETPQTIPEECKTISR